MFSLAVLRVNKAIGAEAQDFFDTRNRFVRVQHLMKGFVLLAATMDLPVVAHLPYVADVPKQRIERHCLNIKFCWPWKHTAALPVFGEVYSNCHDIGIAVMALRHLPRLCEMLRFIGAIDLPPGFVVASARGEKIGALVPAPQVRRKDGAFDVRVTIIDSKPATTLQAPAQALILECLASVRVSVHHIEMTGFDDACRVQELKSIMSPSLVFPNAFVHHFIDVFRDLKQRADALAVAGHFAPAYSRYSALTQLLDCCWEELEDVFADLTAGGERALRPAVRSLERLKIDLTCSSLALSLLLRKPQQSFKLLRVLKRSKDIMTSRMLSWLSHLRCCSASSASSSPQRQSRWRRWEFPARLWH